MEVTNAMMNDPATHAPATGISAGQVTTLLGSILQVGTNIYGGYLQNKIYKANAALTEAQGNYSSAVEQFNAAVARANAEAIRASANLDIERQKKAAKTLMSSQVAGYSKAGVRLSGSPIEVMIDSAQEAKLDMAITDYNANIGVMRAQTQTKGYEQSAELSKSISKASSSMLRTAGKYQRTQEMIKGTTSLLSTVSSYSR